MEHIKTDHILGYKTSLNTFKILRVTQSTFSEQMEIKKRKTLEIPRYLET
jgi:hypothetical protein